ncbi:MAG: hypothetical protein KDA30_15295, partial [Phycisphaerales bacterium]|nr:hypothetical protein [Phycisphaerales bacterium]
MIVSPRGMVACALVMIFTISARAQRDGGEGDRWGEWGGRADPPLRATLRPIDGAAIRGEIIAWTGNDITLRDQGGVELLIRWDELDPRQVYETTRRLIDSDDAGGWLRIGVLMLTLGQDEEGGFADRAFAVAVRLDAATALVADAAKRAHAAGGDPVKALSATPESLSTTPDRSGANADDGPWPELSDAQRAVETARVRARAEAMVRDAGLTLGQIDAGEFILFTDLDDKSAQEAGAQLERMYRSLLRTLELPASARLFQGKAVVFLLTQRKQFVHLENEAFGVDPNGAIGMCHLRDADVFVVCHKGEDETAYMSTLIHETVHGFMYRYKSPAELPIWANEGLADYIAGFLLPNSVEPGRHWAQAKAFVRAGEDPSDV